MGSMLSRFAEPNSADAIFLPTGLRKALAKPWGPIITNKEAPEHLSSNDQFIAVGDVCSSELLAIGITPKIIIHDNQTKRSGLEEKTDDRWEHLSQFGEKSIKVMNPSGAITRALWKAIQEALVRTKTTRIEVEGEEDLASLVCIVLAPLGTKVVYGQPDRGMVVVTVDNENKSRSMAIMEAMTEELKCS